MCKKNFVILAMWKNNLERDAVPSRPIARIISNVSANACPTNAVLRMALTRKKYWLAAFIEEACRLSKVGQMESVRFICLHAANSEAEPLDMRTRASDIGQEPEIVFTITETAIRAKAAALEISIKLQGWRRFRKVPSRMCSKPESMATDRKASSPSF
jgi:hypothetical protein